MTTVEKAPQEYAMAGYDVAKKFGIYESQAFKLADHMYAAFIKCGQLKDTSHDCYALELKAVTCKFLAEASRKQEVPSASITFAGEVLNVVEQMLASIRAERGR